MKKKWLYVFLPLIGILIAFLLLTLTAHYLRSCVKSKPTKNHSVVIILENGLNLHLNGDEASFSVSNGECTQTVIEIPAEYDGKIVTCVRYYAFRGREDITKIVLPESVTSIGEGAFSGCKALTDIELPENLKEIGGKAFSGCGALTDLELPENLVYIGKGAFQDCVSLAELNLPESIESLSGDVVYGCGNLQFNCYGNAKYLGSRDNPYFALIAATSLNIQNCEINPATEIICEYTGSYGAFAHCEKLEEIVVPDSVGYIGEYAFFKSGIKRAVIGSGVRRINTATFSHCAQLKEINLPDVTEVIDKKAFYNCSSLKHIKLPAGLTEIEEEAFYGCSILKGIDIPAKVTSINSTAFADCSELGEITLQSGSEKFSCKDNCLLSKDGARMYLGCKNSVIPDGVKFIDGAFRYCTGLTNITLPKGLEAISDYSFQGCAALTEITVPANVGYVGYCAFENCPNLKCVYIEQGVQTIEDRAFNGCRSLTVVEMPVSVNYIGNEAFSDYVPGLVINYKGTVNEWNEIKFWSGGFLGGRYEITAEIRCTDGVINKRELPPDVSLS